MGAYIAPMGALAAASRYLFGSSQIGEADRRVVASYIGNIRVRWFGRQKVGRVVELWLRLCGRCVRCRVCAVETGFGTPLKHNTADTPQRHQRSLRTDFHTSTRSIRSCMGRMASTLPPSRSLPVFTVRCDIRTPAHVTMAAMSPRVLVLALLVVCASFVPAVVAWGGGGHIATARIAQHRFTAQAEQLAVQLLPEYKGEIYNIASWADQIRDQANYTWSYGLHFADQPDWTCNYDVDRDCTYRDVKGACVDGAVRNYTQRLQNATLNDYTQYREALEFLVHFVGDLHQVSPVCTHPASTRPNQCSYDATHTHRSCVLVVCSAAARWLPRRSGRQSHTGELSWLQLEPALAVGQRTDQPTRVTELLQQLCRLGRAPARPAADDVCTQRVRLAQL